MIDNVALSVVTATAHTRIFAFLVDACLVARTLGVYCAFGTTIRRRTNVILKTNTSRRTSDVTTVGVGSTR